MFGRMFARVFAKSLKGLLKTRQQRISAHKKRKQDKAITTSINSIINSIQHVHFARSRRPPWQTYHSSIGRRKARGVSARNDAINAWHESRSKKASANLHSQSPEFKHQYQVQHHYVDHSADCCTSESIPQVDMEHMDKLHFPGMLNVRARRRPPCSLMKLHVLILTTYHPDYSQTTCHTRSYWRRRPW